VNIDSTMSTIAVESAMLLILSDLLPLNEGTAIGSARALYIGTDQGSARVGALVCHFLATGSWDLTPFGV